MTFWTTLLIIHGLLAIALLGAITHQAVAVWMPVRSRAGNFVTRFRAVPSTSCVAAIGVAYAVLYVIGTELNLPLVTYHPAIGEADVLWTPARRGPAMYWYGWMLSSLLGALVLAWLASVVPEQWVQRAILFGCVAAA